MAIQSSFYVPDGSTRTFPSTKHIASKQHMAVWYRRLADSIWVVQDVASYELINNTAVLQEAPSIALYDNIEIRVADVQDELIDSPSDITIVAGIATEVTNVSDNMDDVQFVSDNIAVIGAEKLIANVPNFIALQSVTTTYTTKVNLTELHVGISGSGGVFIWDATVNKSTANAGTIIDPSVSLANQGSGIGFGCWVRQYEGDIKSEWFGNYSGNANNSSYIQKAINYAGSIGGGIVTFDANTYLVKDRITAVNNVTLKGKTGSSLKVSADNVVSNGKIIGVTTGISNFHIENIIFDGNVLFNTTLFPLLQVFSAGNITIKNCIFKDNAGIALNMSLNLYDIDILNNEFENIGYTTGIGGASAKQAIAFSSGGHQRINIKDNNFYHVGLDCISIGGVTVGEISGNKSRNSYALIYNGSESYRLEINKNIAQVDINLDPLSARPEGNGIDLPKIIDSNVCDNIAINCSGCGIGIFVGSSNVLVSGNICIRNNVGGKNLYEAGIVVKSDGTVIMDNISVDGNILGDNSATPTQKYGLIYDIDRLTNFTLSNTNKMHGNALADIAEYRYTTPLDIGTLIQKRNNPKVSVLSSGYKSLHWYGMPFFSKSASPVVQTTNTMYLSQLIITDMTVLSTIGATVATAVASTEAIFAVYNSDDLSLPGRLMEKTTTPALGTVLGDVSSVLDSTLSLNAGVYWIATLCSGAIQLDTIGASYLNMIGSLSQANIEIRAIKIAATYASGFPSTLVGSSFTDVIDDSCPILSFKIN